jgi:tetratricopeptide (TPR) repeat protein
LPQEIAESATCEQGYVRVLPREPERALMAAMKSPKVAEASAILRSLLEQHPDYMEALQRQGRLLNDLRDHHAALECLERARELRPDSARIRGEMGRAHFLLEERQRARQYLEEAIALNPHYLPAWQYLLRLLAISGAADGPDWAQRAVALFPGCYAIALQSAEVYPLAQAPGIFRRILETHAAPLPAQPRLFALPAFGKTIVAVARAAPRAPEVLDLLRRACEIFPESSHLAGEFGAALYRAGLIEESYAQQAKALQQRRRAALIRSETGADDASPLLWQLAEHIRQAAANAG